MLTHWQGIPGKVKRAIVLITCPCHLAIILPVLLSLSAGTAVGEWLARHVLLVNVVSIFTFVVLFGAWVMLASRWLNEGAPSPPSLDLTTGQLNVTLLTSSACKPTCSAARTVWRAAREQAPFHYEEADISSPRGRKLAAPYFLSDTPAAIINGDAVLRGVPSLAYVLEMVASVTESNPDSHPPEQNALMNRRTQP